MGLTEIITAGLQEAAAAGSSALGKPVEIAVRGVQAGGWNAAGSLRGFTLAVPVSFSKDIAGAGVLLLDARSAALMAELLLGNDPAEAPVELSVPLKDAAAEALSQMVGALGDGIGRASRRKVSAAAGDPATIAGDGAAAARGVVREERVVAAECELRIGAHPPTRLLAVFAGSTGDALASERPAGGAPDIVLGSPQSAAPGGPQVQRVQFGTVQAAPASDAPGAANLDLLLDVPLEITVELGRANRKVRDVLALGPGSIVELNKLAGEPVDMLVNGKLIAKGEVVVIDENFAVRIIEILSREERLSGGL